MVRFGDREGHQIFLEPEGLDDPTVYPNGISTALPEDVQAAIIAAIPGLARTRIVRPGYAIEYDYVDPRELDATLPDPAPARSVFSPARSTAPPAMRKSGGAGCLSLAPTPHGWAGGWTVAVFEPADPISV